jgi:hypothetical protein
VTVGRRRDEIGLETTLSVHRMRSASQATIEGVRRQVPSNIDVIVVVDEGVDPERVSWAADNGVQLVDANQLAESATLVGQAT